MTDGEFGHPRPRVVVSRCLGFEAVRYDGQLIRSRVVERLGDHADLVPVCPEMGVGLGVPRKPVRLVEGRGRLRMLQPGTGRDVTEDVEAFAEGFLGEQGPVDGFILKSRSPTCAVSDARVYGGSERGAEPRGGAGLFARAARRRFPGAVMQDEARLTNLHLRHHFLSALFALARFRLAAERGCMGSLVRFQTEHKLLLMAQGARHPARLGRIAGGSPRGTTEEAIRRYREALGEALRHPPPAGDTANALQHAFGYLSDGLTPRERDLFLELLDDYRAHRVPLAALLSVLRAWTARQEEPYLEVQRFLDPYPRELLDLTDSGAGRRPRDRGVGLREGAPGHPE